MGDTVEIILEYLRRYHFTNAEAAFKAELLARGKGNRSPSSVNVLDWDLEWRLRSLQSVDRSLESEQISVSASDRNMFKSSISQDAEAGGFSLEKSISPSITHSYGEYKPEKFESHEPLCTLKQDFVVETPRISPESGIASSFAGPYLPSGMCEHDTPFQIGNRSAEPEKAKKAAATAHGWSRTDPFEQGNEPLLSRPSVGSLEDLGERGQAAQTTIESAELALMWDKREMQEQQPEGSVAAYNALTGTEILGRELQEVDISERSQVLENKLSYRKLDSAGERWSFQPSMVVKNSETTDSFRNSIQQDCSALETNVGQPNLNVSAAKRHTDFWRNSSKESEEKGDGSWRGATGTEELVKNGYITSLTKDSFFEAADLKPAFPFSFLKSSQIDEQENLVTSEYADQRIVERLDWVQKDDAKFQETGVVFAGNGEAYSEVIGGENQELRSCNELNGQEELPRLPPVRLRSLDKIVDNSKDGGDVAENSTRSFESAAFRSLGSTPEGNLGWNAFIDAPVGQDMSASGFKRPVSRPSVSQGIVEDISEQLSGFATAADGHSESAREYPDEYCDSDTYEDDDDPGYHRQPIEDESWFFAHEIDYPSDDERARHRVDQSDHKQFGKLDEDDRSFVEEESYFSGEEFYRSQAAKEEYRSQQSELRNQVDRAQRTYNSLYSTSKVTDLLAMPRGDDGTAYNGELFDPEEVKMMRSEPAWKGFIGQSNELEQESVVSGGDRLEGASVYGVDDERHGSVRSCGVGVSSDAADVGSEVRDSLLGGSSEGDIERFRDQEFAAYSPAHGRFVSGELFVEKEGRHVEVKSAPVRHLDEEDEDDRDIFLRYYNEAWGHKKRSDERDISEREVLKSELASRKHQTNGNNKDEQDNGPFVFGGFCFPSPSSTGDVAASRADSGKSLWSNRGSAAQGEETDEYGSGVVGPDDTLAAWKRKSNGSSPIVCASEENLPNLNLSNHSTISAHSTDEYVSLEAKEDGLQEPGVGQIPEASHAFIADDEDVAAVQDEIRRLTVDEDLYEIFDLRIVHRKNRTGFEEDKDFPVVINTVIAGRYHVTEYLGSAAFSKAIQAHDLHTGMDVCMKIIKNSKDFFDQSLDEIKLLKFINKHDPADKHHILRLYDYFYHREHLFIVCELLRANLYEFHKFNRESGGEVYFTMPRLQSITRQCLEALEFLHGLGIIHCDLKPENILVKSYSRCEIKIIDLGSSCFQTDHLCSYVQSRSYRAPEVILGLQYDQKIDIWSLGCILAELCSGNVLFQNDSLATLLARVVGILGPIDPEVLTKGRDTHKYFTKNHTLYERNQETDQLEYLLPKKTSLSHRLPMGDQGFVEFVGYLLRSNPAKRPTATEALQHSWLSHPYEPISS